MGHASDYYEILHVHPDAPTEIIKASYRTLMQRLKAHPDLGGDAAQAARINEAYETLRDERKRAAYDTHRAAGATSGPKSGPACGAKTGRARAVRRAAPQGSAVRCPFCQAVQSRDVIDAAELDCERCGATLAPCERSVWPDGERALERLQRRQRVRLFTAWNRRADLATTRDISIHGMLIECAEPLGQHQVVRIESDVCRAVGRVVHLSRDGGMQLAGLEFLTVRFVRTVGAFISAEA